jgi:hypothetical protein
MSALSQILRDSHAVKMNNRASMAPKMAQAILDNHINGNYSEVAGLVQQLTPLQLVRVTRELLSEEGGSMEPGKCLRLLELALEKEL